MKIVLIVHILVTWALIGLIWTIQQVHYPLFARIGVDGYSLFQREHMWRISLLVLPLMLTELITAFVLAFNPPTSIPSGVFWAAAGVVIVIWAITGLVNTPQHGQLMQAFDATAHQALLASNRIRTVLWTGRGLFLSWVLVRLV